MVCVCRPTALCSLRKKLFRWVTFFLLLFIMVIFYKEGCPCRGTSCGCETYISDRGISSWFDKHFNSTIEPLLTKENQEISPDILRWWLRLQLRETAPRPIHLQLFQKARKWRPTRGRRSCQCWSCAVVGNSGHLLGSGYGALIDSHHVVLRMNKAMTEGYESDVGRKTTHHIMYPESAKDLKANVVPVLVPFKPQDLIWLESVQGSFRTQKSIRAAWDKAAILHPAFMKYVHDSWMEQHGRYPSTGLLALILSLHLCDQLSVFGYGADSKGNWHHYWEHNRNAGAFRRTGVHNATFEAAVIQQLARIGKVRLYGSNHMEPRVAQATCHTATSILESILSALGICGQRSPWPG
ncbi:CMP-N-acetylneuraminate-beta-galactosamide-alpha-2,3-sialyltransferase 2-like [Narcine bancroftii]|uniref:CMP-N-acetylneuraminate-beta-galactosamide- alpha-2,3-sialyltransferase 2-like n=1 Tax=Narcine bancroftii TaxID=1343680 RepID=UPI003831AC46